jgi:hypothetical protein
MERGGGHFANDKREGKRQTESGTVRDDAGSAENYSCFRTSSQEKPNSYVRSFLSPDDAKKSVASSILNLGMLYYTIRCQFVVVFEFFSFPISKIEKKTPCLVVFQRDLDLEELRLLYFHGYN